MAKNLTKLAANLPLKLLASMPEGVLFVDADNRIAYCNEAAAELNGLDPAEAIGRPISACHQPDSLARALEVIDALKNREQSSFRRLVTIGDRQCEITYTAVFDNGDYVGTLAVSRDVSEQVQVEREVSRQAKRLMRLSITDSLTGLFNRRHFFDQLKREFGRAKRQHTALTLVMLDLDGFKEYNDAKGHQTGDLLLASVARIAKRKVRHHVDSAYRYGGDEMALLLPTADLTVAEQIANRIRDSVERLSLGVTVSLGIATADHADVPSELVRLADDAMYAAKRNGGNRIEQAAAVAEPPPLPTAPL